MNLRTNEEKLVKIAVMGEVYHSIGHPGLYHVPPDGIPIVTVGGWAGLKLNVRVGDPAVGWEADHLEPGVSIKNSESENINKGANAALMLLACVGNEAIVATGDAKGAKGLVTGEHAGCEHVILDFVPEVLNKLLFGDKIKIRAFGVGLKLLDWPDVKVMNIDPRLLKKMNIGTRAGKLTVPVTHRIPAELAGSGVGQGHSYSGDQIDFQMFDAATIRKCKLGSLRLGDFVAVMDYDGTFGYVYRPGAVSIGVIVHGDSVGAGHGPGVITLMTSGDGRITPVIDPKANLATILGLRKDKKKPKR